jgi:hypothetical protein
MNRCICTSEVWYSERLRTYPQVVSFVLFCLTKLLNMAMVQNVEVILEQTPNHSV